MNEGVVDNIDSDVNMDEHMSNATFGESLEDEYKTPKQRLHNFNSHQVVTKKANGVVKTNPIYVLSVSTAKLKRPTSIKAAL